MLERNVSLTFIEPLLGSIPKSKEVYAAFIEKKKREALEKRKEKLEAMGVEGRDAAGTVELAQQEVEAETIQETEERGWTGFHSDEKGLFLYDYSIKGFFKETANVLKDGLNEKNVKSKLDNLFFIFPRRVPILLGGGEQALEPHGVLERPLRAMTMQGPRVTLARSDYVRAGCGVKFTIKFIESPALKKMDALIEECLKYGELKGLGQFRNGSYGRFTYKIA